MRLRVRALSTNADSHSRRPACSSLRTIVTWTGARSRHRCRHAWLLANRPSPLSAELVGAATAKSTAARAVARISTLRTPVLPLDRFSITGTSSWPCGLGRKGTLVVSPALWKDVLRGGKPRYGGTEAKPPARRRESTRFRRRARASPQAELSGAGSAWETNPRLHMRLDLLGVDRLRRQRASRRLGSARWCRGRNGGVSAGASHSQPRLAEWAHAGRVRD